MVVQVNGRRRGELRLPKGVEREVAAAAARELANVARAMGAREPERVVWVPDRLVNLVVRGG